VVADLRGWSRIALDLETYGPKPDGALDPWRGEIRLLSLARHNGTAWLIDLKAIGYDLGPLAPILEQAEIVAHNAKFDLLWLRRKCGLDCRRVICTMTAARLLTAGTKLRNDLDSCLHRHLGIEPAPDHSRSDWSAMLLTPDQIAYASRDVAYLHDLAGVLASEIELHRLEEVWELETALLPCVVDMEAVGIAVDRAKLEALRTASTRSAEEATDTLRAALNCPALNPASTAELLKAMRAAGLPVKSTREEELKKANDGTIIPLVLRYREAIKRTQQAESFLDHIAPDGRIHARFEPTGTATGRFSSKQPNLQNIGRGELREAFVAAPGHQLVVADYSQIELRAAAAIAGEPKMIDAYQSGTDLHRLTAASVLGIEIVQVGKEQRQLAKAVNFGLLYGQSGPGLARYASASYGVELPEVDARRLRSRFFGTYPRIRQWHGQCHLQAEKGVDEVRTRLGRRRLMPAGTSDWDRFTALVNTPVQGGTADGMKQALVLATRQLPAGARIVATVHDELVVECHADQIQQVRALLTAAMTEAMSALFPEVPIEVEGTTCATWAEK
jgi:DNA polymerase-1